MFDLLRVLVCAILVFAGCAGTLPEASSTVTVTQKVEWITVHRKDDFLGAVVQKPRVVVLFSESDLDSGQAAYRWWAEKDAPPGWSFVFYEYLAPFGRSQEPADEERLRFRDLVDLYGKGEPVPFVVVFEGLGIKRGELPSSAASVRFSCKEAGETCTHKALAWLSKHPQGLHAFKEPPPPPPSKPLAVPVAPTPPDVASTRPVDEVGVGLVPGGRRDPVQTAPLSDNGSPPPLSTPVGESPLQGKQAVCRVAGEEGQRVGPIFKKEFRVFDAADPTDPSQTKWWRCHGKARDLGGGLQDRSACEICARN